MIKMRKAGFLVWLCLCANVIGFVVTCTISLYAGQPWREEYRPLSFWPIELMFLLWSLIPYILLIIFLFKSYRTVKQQLVFLFFTFLIVGFGLFDYWYAFFISSDAQAGLEFIFVPIFQLFGTGIGIGCTVAAVRGQRVPTGIKR